MPKEFFPLFATTVVELTTLGMNIRDEAKIKFS